jgi:hypothetical protein
VPTEEVSEEFRQVCERFHYNLVNGMCFTDTLSLYFQYCNVVNTTVAGGPNADANIESPDMVDPMVAEQPNTEATDRSLASSPPQLPSSQDSDAISISSSSTDWEEEYGIAPTPPPSSATPVSSPAPPCKCTTC